MPNDETPPVEETTPPVEPTEAPPVADDKPKVIPYEKYQEDVTKKGKENKQLRDDKTALEQRLKAFEDAQLSESEKRENRIKELEAKEQTLTTRLQDAAVRDAVAEAAGDARIGAKNPANIHKLIDRDTLGIAIDDNGDVKVSGLDAELRRVKREFPELFVDYRKGADGGAGGGSGAKNADVNDLIRQAAGITAH